MLDFFNRRVLCKTHSNMMAYKCMSVCVCVCDDPPGRYPEMTLDGLDLEADVTEAGEEPPQLPPGQRSMCCP